MKTILLPFAAVLALLFTSCKDNPTAFSFNHDYSEIEFTIDTTSMQGEIQLGLKTIETDIQELAADNGVNTDNFKSVKIKSAELTIVDNAGSPYTFNLLSRVKAEIGKPDNSPLIQIAGKDPVPNSNLTSLSLDVADVELLDYFKRTNLRVNLSGFTNAAIDHSFLLKLKLTIHVEGEVID